jgi:hypothetical protein
MSNTIELTGNENKQQLIEMVNTLNNLVTDLTNQLPITFSGIAAKDEVKEVVENGITTTPASPAIPAVTPLMQIQAIPHVKDAIAVYNKEMEVYTAILSGYQKTLADYNALPVHSQKAEIDAKITTLTESAKPFRTLIMSDADGVDVPQDQLTEAISKNRAIVTDIKALKAELLTLNIPTAPTAPTDLVMPTIQGFINGIPLSLISGLVSAPKVAKAAKSTNSDTATTLTPSTTKKDWVQADIEYIKTSLAANLKFSDIYNHLISLGYTEGQAKGKINTLKK